MPYINNLMRFIMNKKSIIALAILLAVAYGINMSMAGVAIPGCADGIP